MMHTLVLRASAMAADEEEVIEKDLDDEEDC